MTDEMNMPAVVHLLRLLLETKIALVKILDLELSASGSGPSDSICRQTANPLNKHLNTRKMHTNGRQECQWATLLDLLSIFAYLDRLVPLSKGEIHHA
jgi:hypothetical protein